MGNEVWKDIPDYEGFYQASNCGRIKSLSRNIKSKIQKNGFRLSTEKIRKFGDNGNGYLFIPLSKNKIIKQFYIHRLIAIHFIPNPENKPCINHINGIKTDNRVENLEWCTYKENSYHAIINGLTLESEKKPNSKLNNHKVLIIKRLFKINPKFSRKKVSEKYGVANETISKIIKNKIWKRVIIPLPNADLTLELPE